MNSANESFVDTDEMVKCDMCENDFRIYNGGIPERGMDIYLGGGYGLFHDYDEEIKAVLCHDCALVLIRMLPKLANKKGWHSVSPNADDYPLCCEYAWTTETVNGERICVLGGKNHFDERINPNV